MTIGVYAGSFDPFTRGHWSIARGASAIFDKIVIAVGVNPNKSGLFSVQERLDFAEEYIKKFGDSSCKEQFSYTSFEGLLVKFCSKMADHFNQQVAIVRGLRAVSDFEDEMKIADANLKLNAGIRTIFIPTESEVAFVSSSTAREMAKYPGTLGTLEKHYVTSTVAKALKKKLG